MFRHLNMKNNLNYIFLFSLLSSLIYGQKYDGELSEIEYNIPVKKLDHLYQIIETKTKFLDFIGIKKGDIVIKMGKTPINNIQDYMKGLAEHKKGDTVPVKILRDGKEMELKVTF